MASTRLSLRQGSGPRPSHANQNDIYSPASIIAIRRDRVMLASTLGNGNKFHRYSAEKAELYLFLGNATRYLIRANTAQIGHARQEQRASVMVGSVLTVHSEMVSTKHTFSACAYNWQFLPKLHGLVDVPIAVTKICGLGCPPMDIKAFVRATSNSCQ